MIYTQQNEKLLKVGKMVEIRQKSNCIISNFTPNYIQETKLLTTLINKISPPNFIQRLLFEDIQPPVSPDLTAIHEY